MTMKEKKKRTGMTPKQKKQWRLFFQSLRDKGLVGISLGAMLVIELIINVVSMSILAPGNEERIGFMAIGAILVFLAVPLYLRGFKGLWLTFAILSAFLNTSFVLEGLRVQSMVITVENDTELARLDKEKVTSQNELDGWIRQYDEAIASTNMERINGNIQRVSADIKKIELDRSERVAKIEKGEARHVLTAADVFFAIPRAIIEGITIDENGKLDVSSLIRLLFFGTLFYGMQSSIVIFAKGGNRAVKNQKGREPDKIAIVGNGPLYVKFDKEELGVPANPVSSQFEDPLPFESDDEKPKDKPAPFGSRELG
jgi:hypothetical protein